MLQSQLEYFEKKISQIENEKQTQENENLKLKKYLNELKEKEKNIEYFNKVKIEDPLTVLNH